MLTFISEYPSESNIRDGMMLRIREIDERYKDMNRCYLDLYLFRRNNERGEIYNDGKLVIYKYNVLFDLIKIYKRISKSDLIYIQSIFNYIKVFFLFFLFEGKKNIAIDLHGAIPEEIKMQNRKFFYLIYQFIEKQAFKRLNYFIHVTDAMKEHFLFKYPEKYRQKNFKDIVLGIYTSYNLTPDYERLNQIKLELGWKETQIWIIYSGGAQTWQNPELMLEFISKSENPLFKFLILSGQEDVFKSLISLYGIEDKVILKSVSPIDLKEYYSLANLGFVLRTDSIVNKVSNPTKLSEYLAFGIIPIVLNENIGDYNKLGYSYIPFYKLDEMAFVPTKSKFNMDLYETYRKQMEFVKLPGMI